MTLCENRVPVFCIRDDYVGVMPTRPVHLTLKWEEPPPPAGASETLAAFRAFAGNQPLPAIRLVGSYSILNPALQALETEDVDRLRAASAAYVITRLESHPGLVAALEDLTEDEPLIIMLDESSIADFASGFARKRCDRQVRLQDDLWCDAADSNDETAIIQIGARRAAPTSGPICEGCDIPDSRLRCSAFMHPAVSGRRTFGGNHERSLNWAICDAGNQDLITGNPSLCVPEAGHDCWHRRLNVGPTEPAVVLDPLTLPDTLDRLDDVWRLAFGARLIALKSSRDIASLALESGTREDLMDRLRAISEVLNALVVGDSLIPEGTADAFSKGSLNRLETALRSNMDNQRDEERVADSVAVLRRVRRLDNALQHPTGELALLFAEFGISYPPEDWQYAWNVIRAAAVETLRAVIHATRDVADRKKG